MESITENELDQSRNNDFLKDFNKKVKKKHKELFEKPDVKPKEVFEGYKEKTKKIKKKSKSNKV